MTAYVGRCKGCAEDTIVHCSQEELDALPVDENGDALLGTCECGADVRQIGKVPPTAISYGDIKLTKPGFNMAAGVRTPAEQEAYYGKVIERARKQALATKRARHLTRRQNNEMRRIAKVPRELNQALVNETGDKQALRNGGTKLLKRLGLHFDS